MIRSSFRAGILVGCLVATPGCSDDEPTGVVERMHLKTSCVLAGISVASAHASAADLARDGQGLQGNRPMTIDEEFAQLAEIVPGGFGGVYLDSRLRVVVILVDPTQREAALAVLAKWKNDMDWNNARVVKGDYDFAQLKSYYDRLIQTLRQPIVSYDIDEVLNRIVLGVLDDEERVRVAREIVALGDLPCDVVLIKLDVPAIPDA